MSDANKRPDPTTGAPFPSWLTAADFQNIASWGFNSVRYIVSWEFLEPQSGVYDEDYVRGVVERIGWARSAGLLVIVDMHQDLYARRYMGNGTPEWAILDDGIPFQAGTPWYVNYLAPAVERAFDSFWTDRAGIQDHFDRAWAHLARALTGEEAVVGYDLLNEPFPGSDVNLADFDRTRLQPFYEKLLGAILAADPDHIALVEPNAMRTNLYGASGFPSEISFSEGLLGHMAYAPHFYDPNTTATLAYDGNRTRLDSEIRALGSDAARIGLPLWVGEWSVWGGVLQAGLDFLADELSVLDDHLASWSYWDYNRATDDAAAPNNVPEILAILERPQPSKVQGTLRTISFVPSSRTLTFTYREASGSAPTQVLVPATDARDRVTVDPVRSYRWTDGAVAGLKILEISPGGAPDTVSVTLAP